MLKRGGIAIATAASLLVGVALVWLLGFSPLSLLYGLPQVPPVTQLVPPDATAYMAVRAPFDQLAALHSLSYPSRDRRAARRRWQQFWQGRSDSPMAAALQTLDFGRDVQPWLGNEFLVAQLADGQPLIALGTRDLQRSNRFLNGLVEALVLAQTPPEVTIYKGVEIFQAPDSPWVAAAFGNRYVVFAGSQTGIEVAIDDWQTPSLRQHHDLVPGRLGVLYTQLEDGLLTAGLGASTQGLVANFRWQRDHTTSTFDADLLAQLPEDTLAFATDHQPLDYLLELPRDLLSPLLGERYVVACLPGQHWLAVQPVTEELAAADVPPQVAIAVNGGYRFIADSAATLAHTWQDTPLTVRPPWRRLSALLPKQADAVIDVAGALLPSDWPLQRFTAAFEGDTGRAVLHF